MYNYKSDTRFELKMISEDKSISLDKLTLDYWTLMLDSQHIKNVEARESLVLVCLEDPYNAQ